MRILLIKFLQKWKLYFLFLRHVDHKMDNNAFFVSSLQNNATVITVLTLTPAEMASEFCYCLTLFQIIRTEWQLRELFSIVLNYFKIPMSFKRRLTTKVGINVQYIKRELALLLSKYIIDVINSISVSIASPLLIYIDALLCCRYRIIEYNTVMSSSELHSGHEIYG